MRAGTRAAIVLALVLQAVEVARGHGRLTTPTSRQATREAEYLQNEPVSGLTGTDFVCRDQAPITPVSVTAGQQVAFEWTFSAAHPGDCFLYISYDTTAADAEKEWFKLSNFLADETPPRDCRQGTGAPHLVTLPSWLPPGEAVLRWEWYALHVRSGGRIEYYAQCVDVTISSGATTSLAAIGPKVRVGQHLPADPLAYRDAFSPSCDQDLRTCTRGDGVAVGSAFLVGPAIAQPNQPTTTTPTPTPTPTSNPDPATVFVCSFTWLATACSGGYSSSDCATRVANDCDDLAVDQLGLPSQWLDVGVDVEPNPKASAFDECVSVADGLSFMWQCENGDGSRAASPGDGASSSDQFGTGFATGFFLMAGLLLAAGCAVVFVARGRHLRGSPIAVPAWTGLVSDSSGLYASAPSQRSTV